MGEGDADPQRENALHSGRIRGRMREAQGTVAHCALFLSAINQRIIIEAPCHGRRDPSLTIPRLSTSRRFCTAGQKSSLSFTNGVSRISD